MDKPLSASIVTHNSADEIIELLQSMQSCLNLEQLQVYVIDNASTDDTVARIESAYPWAKLLLNQRNLGFGAAHNQVLALLKSRYHAIINPDIVFLEDTLSALTSYLDEHPEAVIATPRILNRDGSEQHLPKLLPSLRYLLARRLLPGSAASRRLNQAYTREAEAFTQPTAIEHASGAFLVIRSATFCHLGGFDERFFLYFEDNDLSKRAAASGEIVFCPGSAVVHGYARSSTHSLRAKAHLLRSALHYFNKHGWRGGTD